MEFLFGTLLLVYSGNHFRNLMTNTNETAAELAPNGPELPPGNIRKSLSRLERRERWLWSTTVAVILLLTLGVASFAFPAMLSSEQTTYSFYLNQAVRALVGLVLLFSVYLVYQRNLISKLRNELTDQMNSIAKVESLASEVYKLAALDQLTGIYNRRSGEQRLEQEISRAQRHGRPLTILLMDIDNLKQMNDTHGHAAGDTALTGFADRLQRAIRGSDLAVRLGGDEFMAILPECRSEEVRHVLARIEGFEFVCDDQKIRLQFSRGWTDYKPGESPQQLLHRADQQLYADKRRGKQTTRTAHPSPVTEPAL